MHATRSFSGSISARLLPGFFSPLFPFTYGEYHISVESTIYLAYGGMRTHHNYSKQDYTCSPHCYEWRDSTIDHKSGLRLRQNWSPPTARTSQWRFKRTTGPYYYARCAATQFRSATNFAESRLIKSVSIRYVRYFEDVFQCHLRAIRLSSHLIT